MSLAPPYLLTEVSRLTIGADPWTAHCRSAISPLSAERLLVRVTAAERPVAVRDAPAIAPSPAAGAASPSGHDAVRSTS